MKQFFNIILIIITLTAFLYIVSCRKKTEGCTDPSAINFDQNAEIENNECLYKGSITFWNCRDLGHGNIYIYINDTLQGSITHYFNGVDPECGNGAGCVNFEGKPNIYSYNGYSQYDNIEWKGSFTINSDQCQLLLIN